MTRFSVMRFFYRLSVAAPSVTLLLLTSLSWFKDKTTENAELLILPVLLVLISIVIGEWSYIPDWHQHFLYPRGLLPVVSMLAIDAAAVFVTLTCMVYVVFQDNGAVFYIIILAAVLLSPLVHILLMFGSMMIFDFGDVLRKNSSA